MKPPPTTSSFTRAAAMDLAPHKIRVNSLTPTATDVEESAERAVEFNAAGFNFLNHANWNEPDPVIGPPSAPNVNAGHIIGSRGGRVIQMGLRFSF